MIISFSLLNFISLSYAQVFEFDAEDYYDSIESKPNTNSEDSDNENCINNQIESVLFSGSNSDRSSSADHYTSNFHFVKKYDNNGNLIDSLGRVGSQDGQFLHAHGITIDSKDNIYVSDQVLPRVQKFESEGNFLTMWGSLGCKDGQFLIPHDIAMDYEENLYVTDTGKSHFRADYDCNKDNTNKS